MNPGQFHSQVTASWRFLRILAIASERIVRPPAVPNPASRYRTMPYAQVWEDCYRNQFYDISLVDGALLQFRAPSFRPLSIGYSFYECPYLTVAYEDFLKEVLDATYEDVGDEFRREYEDYVLGLPKKDAVTPIRYDYDPPRYIPGVHPASHIHFGAASRVRVSARRLLSPLSFTLFIVRHCYPESWSRFIVTRHAPRWCQYVRDMLDPVDAAFISPLDAWHMALE